MLAMVNVLYFNLESLTLQKSKMLMMYKLCSILAMSTFCVILFKCFLFLQRYP
jgi:hypothetical protein